MEAANYAQALSFHNSPFASVCVVITPPLARLLAVANEETCCPSQPQENSNGKLPSILIGGRFFRSPVGRRAYSPAAAPND